MFRKNSSDESEDFDLPKSDISYAKTTLWLDTLFWTFPSDFSTWLIKDYYRSKYFKIPTLNDIFYFVVGKSSLTSMSVKLHRVVLADTDKEPDDGYFLDVSFSVLRSRKSSIHKKMDFETAVITAEFGMENYYLNPNEVGGMTVKCVIKMHEMNCLHNQDKIDQDKLLEETTSKLAELTKFADISSFLKNDKHDDIFSGRQPKHFAEKKCKYIERSLVYASEITHKLKDNMEEDKYDELTTMGVYLGYINRGQMIPIRAKECATLYVNAHHLGLEYLKNECAEFLENYLETDFLIDILIVADMVNDDGLLDVALEVFLKKMPHIINSDRWLNLKNKSKHVAQSIVDASLLKLIQRSN